MARKDKSRAKRPRQTEQKQTRVTAPRRRLYVGAALVLTLLVFYWTPLFSPDAAIHWDAADVHYSAQRYFAETVRDGRLPHWTPFVFSGFPFLSDPQTAAWYPLHWPFFLAGISPRSIQWELVLHCLLALIGMYRFARLYFDRREVAVLAGVAYAFSGYFADHASHVGMFETAAWLPWLLYALDRAVRRRSWFWTVAAGGVVGMTALIGHFQTALYAGLAAALYLGAICVADHSLLRRAPVALAAAAVIGASIGAVLIVPGVILTGESVRSTMDFSEASDLALRPGSLATMLYADAAGAISGQTGQPAPPYLYCGLLLLPLAVFGLRKSRTLVPALALLVPGVWFAFGPAGGFYSLLMWLPGFRNVRAPANIWFVAAFALALLAAAGFSRLLERWNRPYLAFGIPLLLFADLFYWNSAVNPLAYQRASWSDTYGAGLDLFKSRIAGRQPELTRFHAPYAAATFGPLNHPLLTRTETTYGYNPLELSHYFGYIDIASANPKLLNTLGVTRILDPAAGAIRPNPDAVPRAHFPPVVLHAAGESEVRAQLARLDPAAAAILENAEAPSRQDPAGTAEIVAATDSSYRIRCRTASESLLRVAVPRFPGWRATIDGQSVPIVEVDYALMGVLVPAGEHEVELLFRTPYFGVGLVLSCLAFLGSILSLLFLLRSPHGPRWAAHRDGSRTRLERA